MYTRIRSGTVANWLITKGKKYHFFVKLFLHFVKYRPSISHTLSTRGYRGEPGVCPREGTRVTSWGTPWRDTFYRQCVCWDWNDLHVLDFIHLWAVGVAESPELNQLSKEGFFSLSYIQHEHTRHQRSSLICICFAHSAKLHISAVL